MRSARLSQEILNGKGGIPAYKHPSAKKHYSQLNSREWYMSKQTLYSEICTINNLIMLSSSSSYRMKALSSPKPSQWFSYIHMRSLQLKLCCPSRRFTVSRKWCFFGPGWLGQMLQSLSHLSVLMWIAQIFPCSRVALIYFTDLEFLRYCNIPN